jgi:hypothetical protein
MDRWRRAGLLRAPVLGRSRGRARGIARLWEASTVERAVIICRALREGDPSLERAGRALFAEGYALSSRLVREYLREIPQRMKFLLEKRRPYLTQKGHRLESKRQKLVESIPRRKAFQGVPEYLDIIAKFMLGIAQLVPLAPSPYHRLGNYLSPERLEAAIKETSDESLQEAHARSGPFAAGVAILWEVVNERLALVTPFSDPAKLSRYTEPGPVLAIPGLPEIPTRALPERPPPSQKERYAVQLAALLWQVVRERYADELEAAILGAAAAYIR